MIRISVCSLFLLFSFSLLAQDTLNSTDMQGKRHGFWRKVDSSGKVIYEGRFSHGIPTGEFRYFYPNGKLKTVSIVSQNGKRASTISYFPNGFKMAEGLYLNEKKDSIWQFFSESNGTLVSQEFYQAGVINGLSKIFYPDGGLSEQYYYKNGVKDGLWEQYYLDGKIKLRGSFRSGEKEGTFKAFYPDGKLIMEGHYRDGHQDGLWIYYDEKAAVLKKEVFTLGRLIETTPPGK